MRIPMHHGSAGDVLCSHTVGLAGEIVLKQIQNCILLKSLSNLAIALEKFAFFKTSIIAELTVS